MMRRKMQKEQAQASKTDIEIKLINALREKQDSVSIDRKGNVTLDLANESVKKSFAHQFDVLKNIKIKAE